MAEFVSKQHIERGRKMSLVNLEVKYPHGNSFRLVDRKPDGQKFGIGDLVYIIPITDRSMSHFECDLITTVKHSYSQAYGHGGASSRYSLDVASWYNEYQLIFANGKTIEQCRSECLAETGNTYEELMNKRKVMRSIKTGADLMMEKRFNEMMSEICYEVLTCVIDNACKDENLKVGFISENSNADK